MQPQYVSLAFLLAIILIVYSSTFGTMIGTWLQSNTFLHGTLIFPISIYLVWRKRDELRSKAPRSYPAGIVGLLAMSLAWSVSNALDIQVGMQLAATAMIPLAVLTTSGPAVASTIAFPLGFLFFAVPIGEGLVPYLMDFTASFTVKMLNLSGIPVLRSGRYFSIPAGDFEVARACSGIRYLLATLAVGTMFSYLTFTSMRKRLLFIAIALVLPILANGFRAYGIVLIAHFSDMRLAVGFDHIIYGWLFFLVVVLLLFYIGNLMAGTDRETAHEPRVDDRGIARQGSSSGIVSVALASAAVLIAGPLIAGTAFDHRFEDIRGDIGLPSNITGWTPASQSGIELMPAYVNASERLLARYAKDGDVVDLAVVRYYDQSQGMELANSENAVLDRAIWTLRQETTRQLFLADGRAINVLEVVAVGPAQARLVWYWYDVNGNLALRNVEIKLFEMSAMLSRYPTRSSAVILSTRIEGELEDARGGLARFLDAAWDPLRHCLEQRSASSPDTCGISSAPAGAP